MQSIFTKIKDFFISFIKQGQSAHLIILSICVGNYIAFSPFIGFHTLMVFISVWLFKLNLPVTLAVACGVNNPWTAVPIYFLDYIFGYWVMHDVFCTQILNPCWMRSIEDFMQNYLCLSKPCLWSFLIGGNLLGILISIVLYPILWVIYNRFIDTGNQIDEGH